LSFRVEFKESGGFREDRFLDFFAERRIFEFVDFRETAQIL
jgi:hypothetical protein